MNWLNMKRKNKLALLALLPLIALSGCATAYQKEGIFSNGYSDFRVTQDTFVISFKANEYTSPEKVMEFSLRRASELTLNNGYRYFAILEEIDTSREHTVLNSKKDGPSKTSTLSHLYYPSIRLKIKCYETKPIEREVIDARDYLAFNRQD